MIKNLITLLALYILGSAILYLIYAGTEAIVNTDKCINSACEVNCKVGQSFKRHQGCLK